MPKLLIMNGDQAGKVVPLAPGGEATLGRIAECEIVVDNVAGISRRHARFRQDASGAWIVEDLDSQNGVYCNNEKVARHVLKDQDELWFGSAMLKFAADGAPAPSISPDVPTMITDRATLAANRAAAQSAAGAATAPSQVRVKAPGGGAPASATPAAAAPAIKTPEPLPEGLSPAHLDRLKEIGAVGKRIETEFGKVIVGQRVVLHQLLIALFSSGHCLMIGLPGLAKTLMVSTLAQILDLKFKRIQFTPDLMPSDIIGSDVLEVDEETGKKSFRFINGPIFTNMLLADEINRTPPKTQAALLEAMQERQVTAANQRFPLPKPFFVLATQNPLEQEGTYPLPEAQLDRFMFNILVDYPDEREEEQIVLETTRRRTPKVDMVLTGDDLQALQDLTRELPVSPHVIKYATRLVRATRPKDPNAPKYMRDYVGCGAGPRAAQCLVLGAKARAVLDGRINVSCEDVRSLAAPVLRHRLFTNFTADSEGITADDLVQRLLLNVPEPTPEDYKA